MTTVNWPIVLEVKGKPVNAEIIEKQYRLLARQRHPDAGGSNEAMTELNLAKESALKWVSDQILAARQAEAARVAAKQAEVVFHSAYQQAMNAQMNAANANYQQQWANSWGGLGNMANAFHQAARSEPVQHPSESKDEKVRTKWQRVRDILRGRA